MRPVIAAPFLGTSPVNFHVRRSLLQTAQIGYPVIVRSAFALGGLGSGFAHSPEELQQLATQSLSLAPQILVERSMKGCVGGFHACRALPPLPVGPPTCTPTCARDLTWL